MTSKTTTQIDRVESSLNKFEQFWLGHVRDYQRSGLSMAEYARSQGLVVNTFYGWHARLKKRRIIEPESAAAMFHRVKIEPEEVNQPAGALALRFRLPNGIDCELGGINPASLTGFVQTLARLRP
jgi:hypothetical protein